MAKQYIYEKIQQYISLPAVSTPSLAIRVSYSGSEKIVSCKKRKPTTKR